MNTLEIVSNLLMYLPSFAFKKASNLLRINSYNFLIDLIYILSLTSAVNAECDHVY